MKKRFVLLFILVSGSLCYSQTYNERPAVLEIGYGVSVPFGKFESVDLNDSASGYATAGTTLNVMFTYLVNKNLGYKKQEKWKQAINFYVSFRITSVLAS